MIYARTDKPGNGGSLFSIGQLGQAMPESLAYNVHHFNCHQCQAAGRLTQGQRRCEVGNPLWQAYVQAVVASAVGPDTARAGISEAARSDGAGPQALPDGNHGKNDFSTLSGRV